MRIDGSSLLAKLQQQKDVIEDEKTYDLDLQVEAKTIDTIESAGHGTNGMGATGTTREANCSMICTNKRC